MRAPLSLALPLPLPLLVVVVLAALAVLTACPAPPSTSTPPDPPPAPVPLPEAEFAPCDLYSEGGGPPAACATLKVPLDRHDPRGPQIDFFVKRYRAEGGQGRQALWMLQGGPGASGYAFEKIAELFATRFPDVDYYFPDHRGTGRSDRLGCVQEDFTSDEGATITPDEWAGCRADVITAYGESLAQYNTSNAAHDVGLAISAIHQDAQPVFVLGISYGTYWAMRYQQLFPHQAAGVILDSIAPPGLSLLRQDEDTNLAAIDFFAACDADEFCASKLGPDSFAVASALMTKLKAGHCAAVAVPDAPTHVLLRRAMGGLLMDPGAREIIPSMVYRYDRCGERDLAPLTRLTRGLTNGGAPSLDNELWSFVLTHNVLFSEFREDPMPTAAALDAIREASVASRDVTTLFELNLDWPAYPLDEFVGGYATTDTPMLMLQGGLDSATLLQKARVVEAQFTGEHQHWVELPTAGHTTLFSSPFVDESGERRSCGVRLLMAFIADPTAALDTSCVDAIEPLDFSGRNLSLNRNFYGVDDAWE